MVYYISTHSEVLTHTAPLEHSECSIINVPYIICFKKPLKLTLNMSLSTYQYLFILKYPLKNKLKYKPTRPSWWHKEKQCCKMSHNA